MQCFMGSSGQEELINLAMKRMFAEVFSEVL